MKRTILPATMFMGLLASAASQPLAMKSGDLIVGGLRRVNQLPCGTTDLRVHSRNIVGFFEHKGQVDAIVALVIGENPLEIRLTEYAGALQFADTTISGECSSGRVELMLPRGTAVSNATLVTRALTLVDGKINNRGILGTREYGDIRILLTVGKPVRAVMVLSEAQLTQLRDDMKSTPAGAVRSTVRDRPLIGFLEPLPQEFATLRARLDEKGIAIRNVSAFVSSDDRIAVARTLDLSGSTIKDLAVLGQTRFYEVALSATAVTDLTPLRQVGVTDLDLSYSAVVTLEPLRGLRLSSLSVGKTAVTNIAALVDMPLKRLNLTESEVSDLSPLTSGGRLEWLGCARTKVQDLRPLTGLPLVWLDIHGTSVDDLTPLRAMPLRCLDIGASPVSDLSPLKGLALKRIEFRETAVTNIDPLAGMPLTNLSLDGLPVTDLAPIKDMPLQHLSLRKTRIEDVSALKGMSLGTIAFDPEKVHKGIEAIRGMTTLYKINGMSPAAFWTQYDQKKLRTSGLTVPVPRGGAPSGQP